jgi:NTE family protein
VITGTSAGALNAAWMAANAHRDPDEALPEGRAVWERLDWDDVLAPLVSPREIARLLAYGLSVAGVPGLRVPGLLDPAPLAGTVRRAIDFARLAANVAEGAVDSATVVTTSALSGRSVAFHAGGTPRHPRDRVRRIDYAATTLTAQHVMASAAIPTIFPAVHVDTEPGRGWHFDGGSRLNTPIKPALWLGADRVIVISGESVADGPPALAGERRPDVFDGADQLARAVLADPLLSDLHTLTGANADERRQVPYIFVAPAEQDTIGAIARRVFREHYAGLLEVARGEEVAVLGRLLDADAEDAHGELLSYLFFAPEFTSALVAQGYEDGRRWVETEHEQGLWDTSPLVAQDDGGTAD